VAEVAAVSCQAAIIILSARASSQGAKAPRRVGKRGNAASAMFLKPGWRGHRFEQPLAPGQYFACLGGPARIVSSARVVLGASFGVPGRPQECQGGAAGAMYDAFAQTTFEKTPHGAQLQYSLLVSFCTPPVAPEPGASVHYFEGLGGPGGIASSALMVSRDKHKKSVTD